MIRLTLKLFLMAVSKRSADSMLSSLASVSASAFPQRRSGVTPSVNTSILTLTRIMISRSSRPIRSAARVTATSSISVVA